MFNLNLCLFRKKSTAPKQTIAEAPLIDVCNRINRIITAREQWQSFGGHIIHEQQAQHRQTLLDLNDSLKKHIDSNSEWLMEEYSTEDRSCYSKYIVYCRRHDKYGDYISKIPVKRKHNRPRSDQKS
jgi:hypothetical protein